MAFGRTFFPRMSSLSGDAAYTLGARALSSMAYGFAAICAPAIILSPIFFRYWIGADFARVSAPVAQILFPGMWMAGLSLVGFTLLQSQGRADLTGKLSMHRVSAVSGHSLGFDRGFRDCWRGWRLELALHGGRLGDFLGFRNEKAGPSSVAASGRALGRHPGCRPLFLGLQRCRRLARRGLRGFSGDRAEPCLLGGLACVHAVSGESSAPFRRQFDREGVPTRRLIEKLARSKRRLRARRMDHPCRRPSAGLVRRSPT